MLDSTLMEKLRLLGNNDISPRDMRLTPDGFVYDFKVIDPNNITEILKFKEMRAKCMISNFLFRMSASKIQFTLAVPNMALVMLHISGGKLLPMSISLFGVISCVFFGFKMLRKSMQVSITEEPVDENHSKYPEHMSGRLSSIKSSINIDEIRVHSVRVIEKNKFGNTESTHDKQFVIIGKNKKTEQMFLLHHEQGAIEKTSPLCKILMKVLK